MAMISHSHTSKIMITLFVEENNPHTTTSYNSFITDLQFHQLKCTCGHACGLSVHGCYQRFIKTAEGKLCFRICWVACEACGKTHALMRYSIAPLITGLSDDYTSLEAFYRDAPAKGVVHPDGSLKHYAPGTIEKWYRNYKQEGFDALIPTTRADSGVPRKLDHNKFSLWFRPYR